MWTASSFFCDLFYLNVCVFAYMHNLAEASRRREMSWSSGFKVVSCLMPVLDQNPGSLQDQQAAVSRPLRLLLPSFNSFYNSSFRLIMIPSQLLCLWTVIRLYLKFFFPSYCAYSAIYKLATRWHQILPFCFSFELWTQL